MPYLNSFYTITGRALVMRNTIFLLIFAALVSFTAADAYVINGVLDDWGVTAVRFTMRRPCTAKSSVGGPISPWLPPSQTPSIILSAPAISPSTWTEMGSMNMASKLRGLTKGACSPIPTDGRRKRIPWPAQQSLSSAHWWIPSLWRTQIAASWRMAFPHIFWKPASICPWWGIPVRPSISTGP
jgi:hypothetical protein